MNYQRNQYKLLLLALLTDWGLRKYEGQQELIWGGDEECRHVWGRDILYRRGKTDNEKYPVVPDGGSWGIDKRFDHDAVVDRRTVDWKPSCKCGAELEPALVLDPFAGTGTVGEVAKSLGRKAILIDTSEKYCKLAQRRIEAVTLPMRLE